MDRSPSGLAALEKWAAGEAAAFAARFVDEATASASALRAELESVRADASQAAAEFEQTLDELRVEHATTVSEHARATTALLLDSLLTVFNALGKADTRSEALSVLFGGLAREFSRVALFEVRGNRFEGVKQSGFDFENDISKVVIPIAPDSLMGRAITTGRIEGFLTRTSSQPTGMPFGGSPACAVAIPIAVQGVAVAVFYADDSDRLEFASRAPQSLVKFAEVLQLHTLLVVHRISTEQRLSGELAEYATLLVDELELAYERDVAAGKSIGECRLRLKDALECMRRIYAQRVASQDQAAAVVLAERLTGKVDARAHSDFGQDLADILYETNLLAYKTGGSSAS